MVATVAADPAVALKPRDYLVPVGFRLRMATISCANICAIKILVKDKYATICAIFVRLWYRLSDRVKP